MTVNYISDAATANNMRQITNETHSAFILFQLQDVEHLSINMSIL